MSGQSNAWSSEEAEGVEVTVTFIDLLEVPNASEEQPAESKEERQEIRRRLSEAGARCREKRELHDRMMRHELEVEGLMNDTEAENKFLKSKVKELQQQMARTRRRGKAKEAEALQQRLLTDQEGRNLLIYFRTMEKKNKKLREKNEDLTAQLDQLSLGWKYQEEVQRLREAQPQFEHKLEELQEVLRSKDKEIEENSMTLLEKNGKIEAYFNNIEDLRQYQRELGVQLSSRQQEKILVAVKLQKESTTFEVMSEEEGDTDEGLLKKDNWLYRGLRGVKVAGALTLSVLLPVGIMASMVPVCNSPVDPYCNLWTMLVELLEPYSQLHHTFPPVY